MVVPDATFQVMSSFNPTSAPTLQLSELQAISVCAALRPLKIPESSTSEFIRTVSKPAGTSWVWTFAAFPHDGPPKALFELSTRLELSNLTPGSLNERQQRAVDLARTRLAKLARRYGAVAVKLNFGPGRPSRPSPFALGFERLGLPL